MREVHDHYFHLAKQEGYLSRAAYKLIEIDDRKKVLRPGDRVLDCGAAPGSWMQVAAKRVGPNGAVVGIDLQLIKLQNTQPNIHHMQGDLTATPPAALLQRAGSSERRFDVILSDMAPNTTGDPFSDHHHSVRLCQSLLDLCPSLVKPGGNLVMKVFEGEAYADLLKRTASMFATAKGFKPKASRSESAEMYIIASDFKPSSAGDRASSDESAGVAPPKPAPTPGWRG